RLGAHARSRQTRVLRTDEPLPAPRGLLQHAVAGAVHDGRRLFADGVLVSDPGGPHRDRFGLREPGVRPASPVPRSSRAAHPVRHGTGGVRSGEDRVVLLLHRFAGAARSLGHGAQAVARSEPAGGDRMTGRTWHPGCWFGRVVVAMLLLAAVDASAFAQFG